MTKGIGAHQHKHKGHKHPKVGMHVKLHHRHGYKKGGRLNGLPLTESSHPDQSEHEHAKEYSGMGSHVMKEAHGKTDAFKHGGKVMGAKSKSRMDKFARGGRTGGSPFSSAKIQETTSSNPAHKAHKSIGRLKGHNPGY